MFSLALHTYYADRIGGMEHKKLRMKRRQQTGFVLQIADTVF
jgi:hypothetical protein